MDELVYLNGLLVPRGEARISVLDYGFLYGYGLFETMRAYHGRVFGLKQHLERLACSAEILKIRVETPLLEQAVKDIIRANNLTEARVRLAVSLGEGAMVPDPKSCEKPTVLVMAGAYHSYGEEVYQKGFRAIISSIRRNSQSPIAKLKTANYLESLLARQEAKDAGVDEAICLNDKGLVSEASMSNIFIVAGGVLKTPDPDSGILPGLTRNTVLELAASSGIKAKEQSFTANELLQADEAFVTNSLMEIMPLVQVDGKPVGSGKPGPATLRLMKAYRELVKRELGEN